MTKTMMLAAAGLMLLALEAKAQTIDICERTPQVQAEILQQLEVGDCAAVDSEALAGIQVIGLIDSGLTTLQAGDFNGMTGLREIYLQGNPALKELPDSLFDGLPSLVVVGGDGR